MPNRLDYFKGDYYHYLMVARGMSLETIRYRIAILQNLSDDPSEVGFPGEVQLEFAALQEVWEEKQSQSSVLIGTCPTGGRWSRQ